MPVGGRPAFLRGRTAPAAASLERLVRAMRKLQLEGSKLSSCCSASTKRAGGAGAVAGAGAAGVVPIGAAATGAVVVARGAEVVAGRGVVTRGAAAGRGVEAFGVVAFVVAGAGAEPPPERSDSNSCDVKIWPEAVT